jgi:1,4-dihydroxy-2-naphthoate octaprenyltransferase
MFNKHSKLVRVLAFILPVCMLFGIIVSAVMAWLPVLLIAAAVLAAVGYAGYRIYGKRR